MRALGPSPPLDSVNASENACAPHLSCPALLDLWRGAHGHQVSHHAVDGLSICRLCLCPLTALHRHSPHVEQRGEVIYVDPGSTCTGGVAGTLQDLGPALIIKGQRAVRAVVACKAVAQRAGGCAQQRRKGREGVQSSACRAWRLPSSLRDRNHCCCGLWEEVQVRRADQGDLGMLCTEWAPALIGLRHSQSLSEQPMLHRPAETGVGP